MKIGERVRIERVGGIYSSYIDMATKFDCLESIDPKRWR